MTPFLGTTFETTDGEVKVAFITDGLQLNDIGVAARAIPYDLALAFPAMKDQMMDEGKGSHQNPITLISTIPVGLLGDVANLWTAYTKLKEEKDTKAMELSALAKILNDTKELRMTPDLKEDTVIHNDTKHKSIDELRSDTAVIEELKHPIADAMKRELQLRKNGIWERRSSGEGSSTSRG